jgi:hypothetical protein
MPDPLSSDVVVSLKSDPTAALAASLILAGSFPDLVSWAMRALGGKCGACVAEPKANGVGHDKPRKANGAGTRFQIGPRAKGSHNPREAAAEHDQALLALMRANPDASVTKIIAMSGRPRNSAVLSLERLEKAGLVEHASRGKWIAVDPDLLEVPKPRPAGWIEPLSGARVARHSADGRVRDEMTMAASAQ